MCVRYGRRACPLGDQALGGAASGVCRSSSCGGGVGVVVCRYRHHRRETPSDERFEPSKERGSGASPSTRIAPEFTSHESGGAPEGVRRTTQQREQQQLCCAAAAGCWKPATCVLHAVVVVARALSTATVVVSQRNQLASTSAPARGAPTYTYGRTYYHHTTPYMQGRCRCGQARHTIQISIHDRKPQTGKSAGNAPGTQI
eukprot:scaffold2742_cov130-Isochrysis_galbana.AAC.15